MTWWTPLDIHTFARKAGFDNHDANRATALALAATSGADHHDWTDPTNPVPAQQGLWAIPADLVASVGGGDQFSPGESAATARALFRQAGGKWAWHPVWTADAGALVRRTLDALDLDNLWGKDVKTVYGSVAALKVFKYSSPRTESFLARFPV